MDTLFPPSRKRMTELGDKQKFTICANLCEFNATLFASNVSEYGSRGGLAPSVERVCPCPWPVVLTCMSCAREQRPPLNFDRPKPGRPSGLSPQSATTQFCHKFSNFQQNSQKEFVFFYPPPFFCHLSFSIVTNLF